MYAMQPPPSAPAHGRLPDVGSPLDRVIQRLEEVVDQETAALRTRSVVDLAEFNNRKSQGLLDLNKALRGADTADRMVAARLTRLRAKLDGNRAALQMHLDAVREISTVVADTIRDADSDGTYSQSIGYRA
jgi:flagellar biosynthesis/type III secretory pathway chaperone